MSKTNVILEIPSWIAKGLASGKYIRNGSVIRDAGTKAIVKMLDEVPDVSTSTGKIVLKKIIIPVTGAVGSICVAYVSSHKDDVINWIDDKFNKDKKADNKKHIDSENIVKFSTNKKRA